MGLSERTFALVLAMTPGIGGRTVTKVLTRNRLLGRTPEEFLRLGPEALREEYRLSVKVATAFADKAADAAHTCQGLEKRLNGLGVVLLTAVDVGYPKNIEEMDPEPPGVLFVYGNRKLLDAHTFAVLSSRNALPRDLDRIEQLAEEGILNGEVLVAGHDRAEYQRAAIVPLRYGSPRILCLDRGLFKVLGADLRDEAFRAARLWRYEFDPTTDLAVSPFRPDADFVGVNNQVRDRLVACLARRLDFVHINEGGNMHRLAEMALKAGRTVRVCDTALGYRRYRDKGATIITL
jgi:DNA processing protein